MLRLSGDLPILTGPKDKACRSCAQTFSIISPAKRCHHCGYHYCRKCSNYWAAWPTVPMGRLGSEHKAKRVCCFCVRFLKITATGGMYLTAAREEFPTGLLLEYALAYDIQVNPGFKPSPLTPKADLVRAITALSKDGCSCLPRTNERYYRQHSVPDNIPQAQMGISKSLVYPRPLTMAWGSHTPWTKPSHNVSPSLEALRVGFSEPSNSATRNSAQLQATHSINSSQPPAALATGPTLDELLAMDVESIEDLNVNVLKSIVDAHHGRSNIDAQYDNFGRDTLVQMVHALVHAERAEREQQLGFAEILEGIESLRLLEVRDPAQTVSGSPRVSRIGERTDTESGLGGARGGRLRDGFDTSLNSVFVTSDSIWTPHLTEVPPSTHAPVPPEPRSAPDGLKGPPYSPISDISLNSNTGLCVVCQDEEASMAVITCGHMALCKGCSEIIMESTRECPLCRTGIATKSHIIRIFRG
ncbi:hypothetical protein GALMADRAFT_265323 [Galerina marginata CBS 339.88]|uniref:RING-type domain-containing protein n=1 Tax=Galerina marginata (strain CBS 339.88) TaxID=685588 RepID=A0A067TAH0_GALM3|nr:hypothetical protein GALMADRAFT_265323 [Galerina marginata CBS 339.88]